MFGHTDQDYPREISPFRHKESTSRSRSLADEVFEVRANGKQLTLLRKPRDYDPSDHDAIVSVLQPLVDAEPITVMGEPSYDEPIVIPTTDL
jgi:hypothetical protein